MASSYIKTYNCFINNYPLSFSLLILSRFNWWPSVVCKIEQRHKPFPSEYFFFMRGCTRTDKFLKLCMLHWYGKKKKQEDIFLHVPLIIFISTQVNLLTWVAGFSRTRESRAMVQNTQVLPVPDLACTIKSETADGQCKLKNRDHGTDFHG